MPHMGERWTDNTGARNKSAYAYDEISKPLTLKEEKALDPHMMACGTRGEAGAGRADYKVLTRATTWHDQQDSDQVNWGNLPQGTPERTDA